MPPVEPGQLFSALIEQGPAYPLEMLGLRGPVPSFVWYAKDTGVTFLIVDGVFGPERICEIHGMPAGLKLIVLNLDGDDQDDLLAHNPANGKVLRLYFRDLSVCN